MTAATLERWRISRDEIRAELAAGAKPKEFVCLGCAAKVELVATVYPVLAELSAWLKTHSKITLQPRDDVYTFETDGSWSIHRARYSLKELAAGPMARVTEDVRRFKPTGVVCLANFLPFPSKEKFRDVLFNYYKSAAKADHPFVVGKGHTIQIAKTDAEEYLVIDYIRASGTRYYGVANNDTISTIDPNLRHSSWISVFVALNNAINDIFLSGAHKGIKVYPTVDARDPEDLPLLAANLRRYADRFGEFGIEIVERDPLGFGTKSMGATVVGLTDREIPRDQQLRPGQILLATRPIGDLAPLTEILIQQSLGEDVSHLQELRLKVLETMLTPNFEASRVIANYLPMKGEPFNDDEHITACRDMTGPGLLALEELAQDSGKDVYLDDVKLHDELVARVDMPNPTSGTNGAIIIGGMPRVAERVFRDLRAVGYAPWVIGRVEADARGTPKILIRDSLARYGFLKGVKKGIFEHYEFGPGRALPKLS